MNKSFFVFVGASRLEVWRGENRLDEIRFDDRLPATNSGDWDWAEAIAELLDEHQYQGEPVSILLERNWVLSTTVEGSANRSEAFTYQLEEQLPIDAEKMIFAAAAGKDRRLVCVVDRSRLGFVERLIGQGFRVRLVAPATMLAVGEAQSKHRLSKDGTIAIHDGSEVDCISFKKNAPTGWYSIPVGPSLPGQLELLGLPSPRWLLTTERPNEEGWSTGFSTIATASLKQLAIASLCRNANRAVAEWNLLPQLVGQSGKQNVTSPQAIMLCGLIAVMFSIAGVFWIKGNRIARSMDQQEERLAAEYDKRFDDKKSIQQRRRYGLQRAFDKKLSGLESKIAIVNAFPDGTAIQSNSIRFLGELPDPNTGSLKHYRMTRLEFLNDRIVSEIEFAPTVNLNWMQDRMKGWQIEMPTSHPSNSRSSILIFRPIEQQNASLQAKGEDKP